MSDKKITLTEGIEKLKALLFGAEKPAEEIVTTEQKFVDAKLNDGVTIVRYAEDVLAVGVIVNIVDEAGAEMPLPVGDYVLEDGTTFTIVDETGAADNVVLAEAVEEKPEEEVVAKEDVAPVAKPATAVPSAPKRVIKSQVEEHVFKLEIEGVEPIEVDFSSMFKKLEDENTALKNLNKEMFSVIEKLADMPVGTPTETKKKFNVSNDKMDFRKSMEELESNLSKENN